MEDNIMENTFITDEELEQDVWDSMECEKATKLKCSLHAGLKYGEDVNSMLFTSSCDLAVLVWDLINKEEAKNKIFVLALVVDGKDFFIHVENEEGLRVGLLDTLFGGTARFGMFINTGADENEFYMVKKTVDVFLFANDSYEDAYAVALSMREKNEKCYN